MNDVLEIFVEEDRFPALDRLTHHNGLSDENPRRERLGRPWRCGSRARCSRHQARGPACHRRKDGA